MEEIKVAKKRKRKIPIKNFSSDLVAIFKAKLDKKGYCTWKEFTDDIGGEGEDYAVIICYLPEGENLKKYWDDAYDIEREKRNCIVYTDRFPKPDWIE